MSLPETSQARRAEISTPEDQPAGRLRHRVLRAGGWVTVGFLLDKVLASVQLVVLARLLAPADFGLMAASAAVLLAVATFTELGVDPSLIARRRIEETDLAVAWTLTLSRAVLLVGALWVLADTIAWFFRTPALALFLRVHALCILVQGVQSPGLALLLRNLELGPRIRFDLTRRCAEVGATIALALWLRSPWALLWGQLVGFSVGCLLSYRLAPFRPRVSFDAASLRQFWSYGRHFNVVAILIFVTTSGGDFVVGRLLGTAELGLYQVASVIPVLLGVRAVFVMNQVSLPTYARLQEDRGGMLRLFGLQAGALGIVLIPIAAILAAAAPIVIPAVFGSQWVSGIPAFRMLCIFAVLASLCFVMSGLHFGANHPEFQTRIWALMLSIYAMTAVPLTVWFGITGAAGALTLAYAVGFGAHVYYTSQLLGDVALSALAVPARSVVSVAAIGGLIVLLAAAPIDMERAWVLALAALLGCGLYSLYVGYVEYPRLIGLWRGK